MSSAEQPKQGAIASQRHEYELLRELKLPGIVRVIGIATAESGLALLMEDAGDTNLAALIRSRPLSIAEFLNISIQPNDHLLTATQRDQFCWMLTEESIDQRIHRALIVQ